MDILRKQHESNEIGSNILHEQSRERINYPDKFSVANFVGQQYYNHYRYHQEEQTQNRQQINYPNNTLIVDLIKCHRNIATVWPQTKLDTSLANLKSTATGALGDCCLWPRDRRRSGNDSIVRRLGPQDGDRKFNYKCRYNFQMPDQLARANIKLKSDDYDKALSVLTSDIRYQLHLLLYRRIQIIWLLLSTILCIVIPVLLANLELLIIIASICLWLSLQLLGAFVTKQLRVKLDEMLEKSVAQVNSFFLEYNLMLGVINVGSLTTKAKLHMPMVYFDTSQCREHIESIINYNSIQKEEAVIDASGSDSSVSGSGSSSGGCSSRSSNCNDTENDKQTIDYSRINDIRSPTTISAIVSKPTYGSSALAHSQMAKKILLKYSQRWISQYDKRKLMFADDKTKPRHLSTGKCLCQFVEEKIFNEHDFAGSKLPDEDRRCQDDISCVVTIDKVESRIKKSKADNDNLQANKSNQQQQLIIPTLSHVISLRGDAESKDSCTATREQHLDSYLIIKQPHHQRATCGSSPQPWTDSGDITRTLSETCSQEQSDRFVQLSHHIGGQPIISSESLDELAQPKERPDISLELGGDTLMGPSDDLVKRLRLLLELRKNDLQFTGGSLFSHIQSKTPQCISSSFNDDNKTESTIASGGGYTSVDSMTIDSNQGIVASSDSRIHDSSKTKGKRIFRQRDGFFLLGMIGAKKNQQHQPTTEHVLEIC